MVEKHIKTKEIFQTQGTPSKAHATLVRFSVFVVLVIVVLVLVVAVLLEGETINQ